MRKNLDIYRISNMILLLIFILLGAVFKVYLFYYLISLVIIIAGIVGLFQSTTMLTHTFSKLNFYDNSRITGKVVDIIYIIAGISLFFFLILN